MDVNPTAEVRPTEAPADTPLQRAGRVANQVSLRAVRFTHFSANVLEPEHAEAEDVESKFAFTRPRAERAGSHFHVSSTMIFSLVRKHDDALTTVATLRATVLL